MQNKTTAFDLLDAEKIAFLQRRVSINVATTNLHKKPYMTRAFGCRIEADTKRIIVYILPLQNQTLLDNIKLNQQVAVVFSQPSTHQTLQLKGNDTQLIALTETDVVIYQSYRESMVEELQSIGYPPSFISSLIKPIDLNCIGISFTPQLAFSQTPGPDAGKVLGT